MLKVRRKGGENQDMKIQLYDVKGACAMLGGISIPTLYRLIKTGKIAATKIGGRTMFNERDINKLVQNGRVEVAFPAS